MRWICLVLFLALPHSGYAVEKMDREYEIRLAGFKIGDLTATKTIANDSVIYYELKSKVSFWLFFKVDVSYTNTSRFLHGRLTDSSVKTITSREDYLTNTKWVKDHYEIKVDAYDYKKDTFLTKPIFFNIPKIYFHEPSDDTKVYADGYGILSPFKLMDGEYYLAEVAGNKNEYFYRNGTLVSASMDSPIKNYEIKFIQ